MSRPNPRGPARRISRQLPPSPLATADGIDRRVASLLRQLNAMDAEQVAAIAEPVLAHLAAAVANIHRVHAGFCAWATDQPQPHFTSGQQAEPSAPPTEPVAATVGPLDEASGSTPIAVAADGSPPPDLSLGYVSATYRTALRHSIELQTELLRYRAPAVAIAAVRRGWWDHGASHLALTSAGLPGLPMLWPIQVDVPAQFTVAARDADDAFGLAQLRIKTLVERAFGASAESLLITCLSTDEQPPIDDSGHPAYRVGSSVRLQMPVTGNTESDAIDQVRATVTSRLADRVRVFDCEQARYNLADGLTVDDLEPSPLDAQADRPGDTSLLRLLAGPTDPRQQRSRDTAADRLHRLTRALRAAVISDIGPSLGHTGDRYDRADQILTAIGLAPLRCWQYRISVQVATTVAASSPQAAGTAALQAIEGGMPTTRALHTARVAMIGHPEPAGVTEASAGGRYTVTHTLTYLVCVRDGAYDSLAEASVRRALPHPGDTSVADLQTTLLGLRIDRFLDPDND